MKNYRNGELETIPVLEGEVEDLRNSPRARYAKINHKIWEAIRRTYRDALLENAVIMTEVDEALLVQIARDYTQFMHEEKWDLNLIKSRS